MWIVRLALRRPYTFVVLALLLLILSPLAILRTATDIFPNINIPVISVIWGYSGLNAEEMGNRIVSNYERALTTIVNDIEHIESQSLNGIAVVKIFFQPGASVEMAFGQVTAVSQTLLRSLPPGTTPPLVMSYSASSVPILQLALSGKNLSEQQLFDFGANFIRTQLATEQGASIPWPYGGKSRQIVVDLDMDALQAKGLGPMDVVNAVSAQNLILPAGTAKIGALEYDVDLNGSPKLVDQLNDLPIRSSGGTTLYIRDVAQVRDGYSPQTNIVRVDGQRAALLTVQKFGSASTLDIVARVKAALPQIAQALPPELNIRPLADQSLFVGAAIRSVLHEAIVAACLTGLLILLFLGNWQSTLIVAVSIPLAILSSLLVLSAIGETINIMTLGGLALAVGILVDDATVEIENVNRQLALGKPVEQAILDGAAQVAVPAFVSTLSICIVFAPMFLLSGVARFLFVPLAEAVVFAMLASYFLSRTLVPTLAKYLLRPEPESPEGAWNQGFERALERLRHRYRAALDACLDHRFGFLLVGGLLLAASFALIPWLGEDFFPQVDAGQIKLHVRARTGTRIEETARLCDEIERAVRSAIPAGELAGIIDNIGLPYSGINLAYSNSAPIGPGDADIMISLAEGHRPTEEYIRELRLKLLREFPGVGFAFLPADMVSQILNFGLPAPIDIQIVGNDLEGNRRFATGLLEKLRQIPGAVDLRIHQPFNQPKLHLLADRTRLAEVGYSLRELAGNLLISLGGSFQTSPSFWLDPKNGVSYSLTSQSPQYRMDSLEAIRNIPLGGSGAQAPQILGNLADMERGAGLAAVSHYNVQPVIDIFGSVQGRDLGAVARSVLEKVEASRGELPKGSRINVRGQIETLHDSFVGLSGGLVFAIVLAYLLMVVNFQSWLDPLIIVSALPAALAGIVWCLFFSFTPLSVPALTGAIMCMGVATANSILLVSFAREQLALGASARDAAVNAGYTRFRPVLMTALAMIIGMIPIALGLGEGGEQNAPLGRAVIGGLLFATAATLFYVPLCFHLAHGRRQGHVQPPATSAAS